MVVMKRKVTVVCMLAIAVCSLGAQELRFQVNQNEVFEYLNKKPDGSELTGKTVFFFENGKNSKAVGYTHRDARSEWKVLAGADCSPFAINYDEQHGSVKLSFDGTGNVRLTGTWDGKPVDAQKRFGANVTLENAMIVRNLDFENSEKYFFDLLQTDKLPRLVAYTMYFEAVGEETVTVPAGTFRCKKICFSLKDWRSMFYKAYYYVTDDDRRIIVKIDNVPKGGSSELVRIGMDR